MDTEVRPAGPETALATMSPLHREQDRTAPFAADPGALEKAQDDQQDSAPDSDRGVGWHEADQERGDAHQQEGGYQGRLAPDPITVVAEDGGANRARNEANRVNQEDIKGCDNRIRLREEELGEDQTRRGRVEKEVVPLD